MKVRLPRGQVSARRKEKALRVLDSLVDNPKTADHVKQKAASALLAIANREADSEPESDIPPEERPVVILPSNGREPPDRLGWPPEGEYRPVIILGPEDYAAYQAERQTEYEAGAADREAAKAEFAARLALPAPDAE
jgi:hypothetical protein